VLLFFRGRIVLRFLIIQACYNEHQDKYCIELPSITELSPLGVIDSLLLPVSFKVHMKSAFALIEGAFLEEGDFRIRKMSILYLNIILIALAGQSI